MDYNQYLQPMLEWAGETGAIQLRRLAEGGFAVETKSSAVDLVTAVDRECESYLVQKIRAVFPEHGILSEEGSANESTSGFRWVIDPIDGTVNYVHHHPFFGVSLGLEYEGKVVVGVVVAPVLRETFWAVHGGGAFLNGQRLRVSDERELATAVVATGFPYDKGEVLRRNMAYFSRIVSNCGGIRRCGSAALDLCYVAAGRLDAFWELGLKEWDVAAGSLLVSEAGGEVSRIAAPEGIGLIAANPGLVKQLQKEIEAVEGTWEAETAKMFSRKDAKVAKG